jgi:hypothetical protein
MEVALCESGLHESSFDEMAKKQFSRFKIINRIVQAEHGNESLKSKIEQNCTCLARQKVALLSFRIWQSHNKPKTPNKQ